MPSSLALGLSLTLTVILFIIDFRYTGSPSPSVAIPTVWFIIAVSKPISYWINPQLLLNPVSDYSGGDAYNKIILSLLMVLSMLVLLTRHVKWNRIIMENRWVFFLFSFMVLSVVWSFYPSVSLRRLIRVLGDLLVALIVITDKHPFRALNKILYYSAYLLIPLSIVLIKYFGPFGRAFNATGTKLMWTGASDDKNTLGIYCCFIAFHIITQLVENRRNGSSPILISGRIGILLISLWLLSGGTHAYGSATAIITFLAGMSLYMLLKSLSRKSDGLKAFNRGLFIFIVLIMVSTTLIESIVSVTGRDMTFTGRDVIWRNSIAAGMRSPVIGVGYGSFWLEPRWNVNQAHNGYIDVFLELGISGLLLLVLYIMNSYRKLQSSIRHDPSFGVYRFVLLMMILMHNLSESSLLKPTSMVWLMFLFVSLWSNEDLEYG